jgi:hypothetical protein
VTAAAISKEQQAPAPRKAVLWTGRVISVLPALMLSMSAAMKLSHAPQFVATFTNKLGYQETSLTGIGLLELACTLLYLIPQTAFLGALLLTGYLGGAIATHVRIGEPFHTPLILGVLVWVGLYLRESRLKALAPIRST